MHKLRFVYALALALTLMLEGSTAAAQAEWAVVPYGHGNIEQAQRAAESVVRALLDRRVSVVSLHETRDRLVARSHEPNETTAEDRARVREGTARAIEHAAYGRRSEARNEARTVLSIAERSMETLNRESAIARLVLGACLICEAGVVSFTTASASRLKLVTISPVKLPGAFCARNRITSGP